MRSTALSLASVLFAPVLFALVLSSACGGDPAPRETTPRQQPPPRAEVAPPEGEPTDHLMRDARLVSAGGEHTCALVADGAVFCWGDNTYGQLGTGGRESTSEPVRVVGLPPARWVSAGRDSTCAISLDDEVFCWGANAVGQLGDGEVATGSAAPVRTELDAAATIDGSQVAPRRCGLRPNGAPVCWGELTHAQRPALASERPREVDAADAIVQIEVGGQHECVLRSTGAVACRGLDTEGELGADQLGADQLGADRQASADFVAVEGIDDVVDLAAGGQHTCALDADGAVHCWGDNSLGQLGVEGPSQQTTPVRVTLPFRATEVVAGVGHTCALDEEAGVHCWGDGAANQLGDGTEEPAHEAHRVPLRAEALWLSAGARHTCVVLVGGEARCWGDNVGGQLGDGTFDDRVWPVAVLDGPEATEEDPETRRAMVRRFRLPLDPDEE